ncbi:MAG: hypothetical protein ACJA09_002553 [Alcanivorax sp.]|jgi:hypothetical protein
MIPDAAPHFISLLQALAGTGDCEEVKLLSKSPDELTLKCRYRQFFQRRRTKSRAV